MEILMVPSLRFGSDLSEYTLFKILKTFFKHENQFLDEKG